MHEGLSFSLLNRCQLLSIGHHHWECLVTNLPKMSSERTPDLCRRVVRVIEVIDFVYIFGIGEIVGRRISVNWGTCDLRQLSLKLL
jgi:hypothetical protein